MAKNVIVDSGYWYALFDARESRFSDAQTKAHFVEELRIVFPWPILYETVGTRFVKNQFGMGRFEALLKRPNTEFIDDSRYRDEALEATFRGAELGKRPISLCDMLIRLLIQDTNLRIDALPTYNNKDFHDVCWSKGVVIL